MKFADIPQLIQQGSYEINMPLDMLADRIKRWQADPEDALQLEPDFQRGRVWTRKQQENYLDYFFSGGRTGLTIYLNKPSWMSHVEPGAYDDFVVVDGLQRINALLAFLNNKARLRGCLLREFEDRLHMARANDSLRININNLKTKEQVLTWYLQINAGGTPHTAKEIARVQQLLEDEKAAATPPIKQEGGSRE